MLPTRHPALLHQQLMQHRVVCCLFFFTSSFDGIATEAEKYKAKVLLWEAGEGQCWHTGRSYGLAVHPRAPQTGGPSPALAAETSWSNFLAEVGGMNPTGV